MFHPEARRAGPLCTENSTPFPLRRGERAARRAGEVRLPSQQVADVVVSSQHAPGLLSWARGLSRSPLSTFGSSTRLKGFAISRVLPHLAVQPLDKVLLEQPWTLLSLWKEPGPEVASCMMVLATGLAAAGRMGFPRQAGAVPARFP